jgi:cytochrome P450
MTQQARTLESIRSTLPGPAHVPKDLLVDLQWAMGREANDLVEPYSPCAWLLGSGVPRLLYDPLPRLGGTNGSWVVSHYKDIQRVYEEHETFSTVGVAEFQAAIGETFHTLPLALDPPEHGKYRKFLNQFFSPVAMLAMEQQVRSVVAEMIDEFSAKGEVDIAWDFGRVYPVRIFMDMMGFPMAMFEQFLDWEWKILHANDPQVSMAAMREVIDWLRGFMAEQRTNPDGQLTSKIVHGESDGVPFTEDEQMGMVWLLWLGGLDTVASTISQMFRRMALQPELQAQLRADPCLINSAVEEFLRTQPLVYSTRTVTKDIEWHGTQMKAGDQIQCLTAAGNFDPAQFENGDQFDPARKANRHYTLIGGVHLCLGAALARRELRFLLEEFFQRIPTFRIKPGTDTSVTPGLLSIRNLPIVWDVAAAT